MAVLFASGASDASTTATFTFSAAANNKAITWTWSEDRQIGQFANGDWWVVGPITLTGVTRPNGAADKDGTQFGPAALNTWGTQGFDSRAENITYNPSVNIANSLPYPVPVNSSLISAISKPALDGRNQLDYQAVLTVMPSAPPAGSFRPCYAGTNKAVIHNKSEINYAALLSLAPVSGTPSLAGHEEMFRYPIISLGNEYPGVNYFTANYNCPIDGGNYGREMSLATSSAALSLNLNYTNAQKEALAIRYIQYGLDIYGGIVAGMAYPGAGGQNNGRKIPMLFAGALLNDSAILAACNGTANKFSEDVQHFYVTQNDVNLARYVSTSQPAEPYPQSSIGMAEWGPSGGYPNNTAGYQWGRTYRAVACPNLVGAALAVKLMGREAAWADQAFVDYYFSRFVPIEHNTGNIDGFMLSMWDAYSGSTPVIPTVVSNPAATPEGGNYTSPQSVSLSTATSGATIYYTTDGSTPTTGSTLYTSPFAISATTTLKAFATKSGLSNSGVITLTYTFTAPPPVGTGVVSLSSWPGANVTMESTQSGNFTISIKATPSANNINAQVALSQGQPTGYGALAVVGRFNSIGQIDASNNNPYTAKNVLNYSAGVMYTFEFVVNMVAKTYDLRVTPAGGIPTVIAENYAFRATAPSDQLTNVAIHHDASSVGTITVGDIVIANPATAPARPEGLRVVE